MTVRVSWRIGLMALAGLAAVALLTTAPEPAGACDDPVYVLARDRWPRQPFMLLLAYQPDAGDPKPLERLAYADWLSGPSDRGPISAVNLMPVAYNMARPDEIYRDRYMLEDLGVSGYPMIALLGDAAKPLARFRTLEEARQRLSPPSSPGEVVSYHMRKITLESPASRIVIFYDSQAQTQSAPATQPDAPRESALVPSRQLAETWAQQIAAEPLAELNRADLVDIRQPGPDAALVQALQLRPLPVCALIDPDFRTVGLLDHVPSDDEVKKMVFSPVREELTRLLEQPDIAVILLVAYGSDEQANKQALEAAEKAAQKAGRLYERKVAVVEVDPADEREEYLLLQLDRQPGQAEPIVVPIFGQGRMWEASRHHKDRPIDSERLLTDLDDIFHPGCADRPVGFDLLMGASGQEWAKFQRSAPVAASSASPVRKWVRWGLIGAGGALLLAGLVLLRRRLHGERETA